MKNKFKKLGITAFACVLSLTTAGTVANLVNSGNTGNGIFTKLNAEGTGHITINANVGDNGVTQSLAGKKFNIYRIFDAQNSAGMESINYTMNPAYEKSLKKVTGKDTEYAIIDYIQTLNNNQVINDVSQTQKNETAYSNFRYFVESLRNMLVEDKADPTQVLTVPSTATDSYTLDVAYGWYIIDEITSVNGTHSAASMIMVNTANPDVAIDIKSDFPVIQKQILEDDNQKNIGADKDGWNDVGDYEIGQTVPYRYLTYAPDMNGYENYYFAMHDRMDSQLTFNKDSVAVKVGNKTLVKDTDYKVVTTGLTGETFQIQITDLKATINKYFYASEAGANPETEKLYGQKIVVEYSATLNESAQADTGRAGFENDVRLEYSNDPDSNGTGKTGLTPWDTVVAFTFRMDGIKVNDQTPERKLEGAKFRLYSDEDCTKEVYVKKASGGDGYTVINRDSVTGDTAPNGAVEMISDSNGVFNIIGLDSQVYYLKETKAPDGYRLLKDPIKIDVKATYGADNRLNYVKGDGATAKTLQKLAATASFKEFYTGAYSQYDKTLSTDADTGTFNIKVVNKVGSKLPATGSMATLLLVATGTAVMVTVLIRRRKNEKDENSRIS
ncbi:isopeptide-forming domain-containing fimbrial protein [Thomasclavelia ramosa]|uniref:isopeptide-forming domain-containing fimbrial protein n=4 Tax=Thomasclavelia ramosa TaxID=1547 RepID=UPI0032424B11